MGNKEPGNGKIKIAFSRSVAWTHYFHAIYLLWQAELKFERIRQAIQGKPYQANVNKNMFCVNCFALDSNVLR